MSMFDLTIGALEIGVLLASVVFGVVGCLAFSYVELGFNDPVLIRLMVVFTCVVETAHTVFAWTFLYSLTVTGYGNPATILKIPWSFAGATVCTACMSLHVQLFLGHRIRVLSGSLVIPIIGWIGSLFHATFTFALTVLFMQFGSFTYLRSHKWMLITDMSVHVGVDILFSIAMVYYLLRKRSSFKATQRIVDQLIVYSLESGSITCLFSLVILTCSLTMDSNFVYIGVLVIYPKIFSVVFLVSLTSRQNLRREIGVLSVQSGHKSGRWTSQNISDNCAETTYMPDNLELASPRIAEKKRRITAPEIQITTEFETSVSKGYESDGTTRTSRTARTTGR